MDWIAYIALVVSIYNFVVIIFHNANKQACQIDMWASGQTPHTLHVRNNSDGAVHQVKVRLPGPVYLEHQYLAAGEETTFPLDPSYAEACINDPRPWWLVIMRFNLPTKQMVRLRFRDQRGRRWDRHFFGGPRVVLPALPWKW